MKATTGSRLPAVTLHDAASGAAVTLRARRGPLVLLAVHPPGCADCRGLVAAMAQVADRVREWGGRMLVVVPDGAGDSARPDGPAGYVSAAGQSMQVVVDDGGKVTSGPAPSIAVADEWGEVFFAEESAGDHRLTMPLEVLDWVRFIGIQCPECEGPEGEWRRGLA